MFPRPRNRQAILKTVLLPTLLCGLAFGGELGDGDLRIPHRTVFGTDISDEECRARDSSLELKEVMDGHALPYSFTGPSQNCSSLGCVHPYWGRRCRFDNRLQPSCDWEDRRHLTAWLADLSRNGADWARSILGLKPCDLWPQLRGRTTWVIGDSVSQDMAFGLACFLSEYFTSEGHKISDDPATMRTITTSANGKELTTWCFNMTTNTRICSLRANKVPRMAGPILRLLPTIASREDIVILNLGAWYNYLADGMESLKQDMIQLEAAISAHRRSLPHRLFWRECTAQHFDTPSGMFDFFKTISEQRCAPPGTKLGVSLEIDGSKAIRRAADSADPSDWEELKVMLSGGHRNRVTQPAIDRLGLVTLPIWNVSLIVHNVHKNYHAADSGGECVEVQCDCSHACSPSWYQMMLPDFNQALLQHTTTNNGIDFQKRQR